MGSSLVTNGAAPMLVRNCPLTTSSLRRESFDTKSITRFGMIMLITTCLLLLNLAIASQLLLCPALASQLLSLEPGTMAHRLINCKTTKLPPELAILLGSQFEYSPSLSTCSCFIEDPFFLSTLPHSSQVLSSDSRITQGDTPPSTSSSDPNLTPLSSSEV